MTRDCFEGTNGDSRACRAVRPLSGYLQIAEARTSREQTLLQRQIEATDKHIDRLVYELYELTEEEIGIVEAGAAR
jgi:hypothetical protein